MAEDTQDVVVSSESAGPPTRKYQGLSPIQAGLLYGGAASTVMGPLGLLVGAIAGIGASRMRKSYLDQQALYTKNLRDEQSGIQDEANAELKIADPDEARLINHYKRVANDGWYRLAQGDQTGRAMIEQANAGLAGIMNGDIQQRKAEEAANAQFQRGLISTAATSLRAEYQANMAAFEDAQKQSDSVLKLVNSDGFDPNKPFNKAVLAQMLSTGIGGFYKDSPDAYDAITQGSQALRSIPVVGGAAEAVAGAITTAIKSKDFQLTAEDYNRIALNLREFSAKQANDRMQRLGTQAKSLDTGARNIGAIGQDYSLGDYVTGMVRELKLTPVPTIREQPIEEVGTTVSRAKPRPATTRGYPMSGGRTGTIQLYPEGTWQRKIQDRMNQSKRPTN